MTTAKPTADVLPRSAEHVPARWALVACGVFAVALAAVVACGILRSSNGHLLDAPAPIIVDGAELVAVAGISRKENRSLVLEAPGREGIAILTAQVPPFAAQDFDRVEWTLSSAQAPPELAFVWRTRENPRRNYTKRLRWQTDGVGRLDLTPDDGWTGSITGVGLLVGPGLAVPLRIASVRLDSPSILRLAGEAAREWSAPYPLRGYSVNYPFDAERDDLLPLVIVIACAEGAAMALYLVLARRRGWPRDRRVLWGIFLCGWLLLDFRWQVNVWREAVGRGSRFAGKSTVEMHLAAEDSALFSLMEAMKKGLPATPSRVFLYCDNDNLCARAAFMLYPHNVYRVAQAHRAPPGPEQMHEGDHVLLLYSQALGYDRDHRNIVWRDGRTRPADELLLQPGALLLRVR